MDRRRPLAAAIASLVPLGLAAGGCSSLGPFEDFVCVEEANGLAGLTPVNGVDFVHLRSQSDISQVNDLGSFGEACKTATDKTKCQSDLGALVFKGGLNVTGIDVLTRYELTFTKGDTVGTVQSAAELLALIGTVDTGNEAALVAFANGHEMVCSEPNIHEEGDRWVVLGTKGNTCGGDITHYEVFVGADGAVSLGEEEIAERGDPSCAIGRRPSLLQGARSSRARCASTGARSRSTAAGRWFARVAELEAASVVAFEELALALRFHGAPRGLVRAALRSRRDEIRHAWVMTSIARRHGGVPSVAVIPPRGARPLADVVHDNATEGCVRETFGALIATVQAHRAADPSVRRELSRIAEDETRHAELSWAIHDWGTARLAAGARAEVRAAQKRALAALRAEVQVDLPAQVQRATGMPDGATQLRLLDALAAELEIA